MKEHPILFSTPMVKAILDGRKTMTRRVVKHQDCVEFDKEGAIYVHHHKCPSYCEFGCNGIGFGESPYGLKGNHLWVRETFTDTYELGDYPGETMYKATYIQDYCGHTPPPETWDVKWKPSIFMPRWASRIVLKITNVRVERLSDIPLEDTFKEGWSGLPTEKCLSAFWFEQLWDSINGKKYPWKSNPWVWVIEFKKA